MGLCGRPTSLHTFALGCRPKGLKLGHRATQATGLVGFSNGGPSFQKHTATMSHTDSPESVTVRGSNGSAEHSPSSFPGSSRSLEHSPSSFLGPSSTLELSTSSASARQSAKDSVRRHQDVKPGSAEHQQCRTSQHSLDGRTRWPTAGNERSIGDYFRPGAPTAGR